MSAIDNVSSICHCVEIECVWIVDHEKYLSFYAQQRVAAAFRDASAKSFTRCCGAGRVYPMYFDCVAGFHTLVYAVSAHGTDIVLV